jgi:8-oxo-dGTP pyrophosphatase MutT (NUDIX family)
MTDLVEGEVPSIAKAAGVIARSPFGRILMCKRTDGEGWAFPGGHMKDGEDEAKCAIREFWEETGYRLGRVQPHMRRVKSGVDFTTFITDVEDEFIPKLNHEHSAWGWFTPKDIMDEGLPTLPPLTTVVA